MLDIDVMHELKNVLERRKDEDSFAQLSEKVFGILFCHWRRKEAYKHKESFVGVAGGMLRTSKQIVYHNAG